MGIVTAPVSRPVRVRSKANWLHSPQRVWLRRAVFQIHLWAGVALSLYCVVIGLSGSALVFRSEIDDWLHSELQIQRETPKITMDAAVHAIETARPGWRGVGLEDLDKADRATALLMRHSNAPSTANYRQVSFNPYTGQVVLDRMRYSGVLGWMTNLHYYLLAGPTGLLVSGWMAVGLLLLCVTGLILWWPGVRRWASGLVLRRRASWRRINWDLHVVIGFWANALLLVITLTGVYFAFPDTVRDMVVSVSGGKLPVAANSKPFASAGSTVLTIDEAIAAARKALPPNAPPDYFFLPDRSAAAVAPYSATGYYAGTAPFSQLVQVSLDSYTGAVLSVSDTRQQIAGMRFIQYFFAVHFGLFGGAGVFGFVVKLVWVALGITPALLAVTGLIMYWNRKLRPLLRRNIIH